MKFFLAISLILISVFIITEASLCQTIKGKVTDGANSDPLIGVVVKIEGTSSGAVTDLDGFYEITDIAPGVYTLEFSYIGYKTRTVKDIKLIRDETSKVNITLQPEGVITEEISVESSPTLANEEALLLEQKNSIKIQDGISEQQIKRAPDAAASDVLKRVIGVNVVDNKFVYVRGTSERYNNTTLNGVLVPSTEADRKAFSFDLIPSKLLENAIVTKSFTPDLTGNFSGGLVQLNTKDFVDRFTFSFETIGSIQTNTTSEGDFYSYNAGQKKFLFFNTGRDNGGRSIPSNFPSSKFSTSNNYGQSLINNWGQTNSKAPLNGGYQLTIGNNFRMLNNPLGVLFSYTYRNGFLNENLFRAEYNSDTTTLIGFNGRSSNYIVFNGGILNLNYKIGDNNKISSKSTYSINSDDITQYYEGVTRTSDYFDKQLYGTFFTERILFSTQLSGSHYLREYSNLNLSWVASYSEAERNEPDSKTTYYQREEGSSDPFQTPLTISPNSNVGQRFYSYLYDVNRNAGVNLDMNFIKLGKQKSKIKYGLLATGTRRNFDARLFAPKLAVSSNLGLLPLDKIFSPEYFDPAIMYMVETTDKSDSYTASENTYAGYVMFDFPINKLRIITGLRYENDEQKVNGFVRTTGVPVNVFQVNNDYLPVMNLTYALNDKTNLRASATQTVSRPELREIAPFGYIDFVTGGVLAGNPELEESLIQNYDFRYELYPNAGEIFSLSLFYKHFDQPIEKVIVPTLVNTTIPSYTFENATGGAYNYGCELEVRKNLGFISQTIKDFTFNGNLALINSRVNLEGLQSAVSEEARRLQGQSPYTFNLALYYDNFDLGMSVNVLYNQFGEKIAEVGRVGFNDVYESGRGILDFSAAKTFLENFEAKFTARNLLNQDITFTQNFTLNETQKIEKTVSTITTGTNYGLSLTYKF